MILVKSKDHGNTTHGMSKDITYSSWHSMKDRCNNSNHDAYYRYGGYGILICQLWNYSFEDFLKDMGRRPSKNHSIERIDNSIGYYPKNCRWATREEQENNKNSNRRIIFNGCDLTLSQWAKKIGLSKNCLFQRLKRGWSEEDTLTKPKGYRP